MNRTQITADGYKKLEAELNQLKTMTRPAAVDRLTKARGMGDLSENSEYTAAKEALNLIDERIKEMEEMLKNCQVVGKATDDTVVELGETVTVESEQGQTQYTIVGEFEADPQHNKLSASSPIGKALLGKKIGDQVTVKVPAGSVTFKIIKIQ